MTPVVCVIDRNYFPFLVLGTSLLTILIFSKFKFHNVIRSQVEHLIWYFKNNLNNNMPVSERNSFSRLLSVKREKNLFQNMLHIIVRLVQDNSYSSIILKFPAFLLLLILLLYTYFNFPSASYFSYNGPIFAGVLLFLLTSLPLFLFLGEAERYINHVSYFVIASFVYMCNKMGFSYLVYLSLLYGLVFLF